MKFVIVSTEIPNGIIAIHSDQVIANWVSKGLTDSHVRIVTPNNCQEYNVLDKSWVLNNNAVLNDWPAPITFLENDVSKFSNTKVIADKRITLFESLKFWSVYLQGRINKYSVYDFPSLAGHAVLNSDPKVDRWHEWVLDHASIHNLTPQESYRELKLLSDAELDFRFRAGSFIEKWVNQINETTINNLKDKNFIDGLSWSMKTEFLLSRKI